MNHDETRLESDSMGEMPVHTNDDVNRGQSSNDTFPTAIHVAACLSLHKDRLPSLKALRESLDAGSRRFREIVRIGRTHLMDATPVRLGQESHGYAKQVERAASRAETASRSLNELPPTQPGSSIMPGKVNPVMCEVMTMVAARIFGNQTTITWSGANGHLEFNGILYLRRFA